MKVKYTKLQVALEVTGLLLLLGMFLFIFIKWNIIPNKIPGHYNSIGEIDRWGSKSEIIIAPIIGAFLYALLTGISFMPETWNIPTKISDFNKELVYKHTKSLLIFMKIELIGIFFYITYQTVTTNPLSSYFLPVQLLVIFGTIIYFVILILKSEKKKRY